MTLALRHMAMGCCLMLGVLCGPAMAADFFRPYSSDGVAVRLQSCGQTSGPGAVLRDLGRGVTAEVRIVQQPGDSISASLLFRSHEPGLQLVPDDIRLHVFPGGMVLEPSAIRRAAYRPTAKSCQQHGEWLHLTFPPHLGMADQVALVFPADVVVADDRVQVKPFRFERTDEAAAEARTPVRPPITEEAFYPSARPRHPLAKTPESLKGVWVIDPKGSEEVMKKTSAPSNEPALVGTMIGFWFFSRLTFDDDALTVGALRGGRNFRYRLISSQGGKSEYVRDAPAGRHEEELLTVTFLAQDRVHVRSTKQTAIDYCAWQRGRPMNDGEQLDAAKRAMEAFQATMQNVEPVWFPTPANKPETVR